MICPKCKGKVRVEYCLPDTDKVVRKRKCCKCGHVFYTSETESAAAHYTYNTLMNEKLKKRAELKKGGVKK